MSARFGKGLYRRLRLRDDEDDSLLPDALFRSADNPRVVRDQQQGDEERGHELFPAGARDSNDGSAKVLRDDDVSAVGQGRKALSQLDVGLLLGEPGRNKQDGALSNRTII